MFLAHNERLFDGFSDRFFQECLPSSQICLMTVSTVTEVPSWGGEAGRDWLRESPSLGDAPQEKEEGLNCHLLRGHWLGWCKCQGIGMKFGNGQGGLEAELARGGR